MADENRIATFEWLKANLSGFEKGTPPTTKKGVRKDELIANYNVDETLVSGYEYNRLVPRQYCVGKSLQEFLGLFGFDNNLKMDYDPTNSSYVITSSKNGTTKSDYYKFDELDVVRLDGVSFTSSIDTDFTYYDTGILSDVKTMHSGRRFVRKGNNIELVNNNYSLISSKGNNTLTVSPNKELACYNSIRYNDTTNTGTTLPFLQKGILFNNGRLLTQFKTDGVIEYPTLTTTTLGTTNEYLVLESQGSNKRLSKWSMDFTKIPANIYGSFIDDINKNSIEMKVVFRPGHTSRALERAVQFDFSNNKVLKLDIATQNLLDPSMVRDNGTKLFIRFGSDIAHDYYEYELPTFNILGATTKGGVWLNKVVMQSKYLKQAIEERDTNSWSILQRYAFPDGDISDPNYSYYVKGNPILNNVTTFMVGLRNTSGASDKQIVVWYKDVEIFNADNSKLMDINIQRPSINFYPYNVYPYIVNNQEGYEELQEWQIVDDRMSEIMLKNDIIYETETPTFSPNSVVKLVTTYSNTNYAFISTTHDGVNYTIAKTSDINTPILETTLELKDSIIKSNTENLLVFKQPSPVPTTLTQNKKIIGLCKNF